MGTLSKGTGAVAGISQRQGRYKRSAPAFLIILAALVLLLGFSMILSVCTGIAGGSFKVFAETVTDQDLEMIPLSELPQSWNKAEIFVTPPQNL